MYTLRRRASKACYALPTYIGVSDVQPGALHATHPVGAAAAPQPAQPPRRAAALWQVVRTVCRRAPLFHVTMVRKAGSEYIDQPGGGDGRSYLETERSPTRHGVDGAVDGVGARHRARQLTRDTRARRVVCVHVDGHVWVLLPALAARQAFGKVHTGPQRMLHEVRVLQASYGELVQVS